MVWAKILEVKKTVQNDILYKATERLSPSRPWLDQLKVLLLLPSGLSPPLIGAEWLMKEEEEKKPVS